MDLTAAGSGAPLVFLEFGLLLLGLGLLARIADWLAISAVPLYLVVGLFFGEGTPIGFDASDEFVSTVSELGMVMLLLFLGMEYSSRTLLDGAATTARTGVVDVLLNATPGAIAGLLLGWGAVGAVALGGVTYVSSSGIISQLVRDFGWRRNPETPRVVGLLVVEDLMMAPYLPVLTVLLTGAGLASGLVSASVGLVVVAVVIWIGLRPEPRRYRILSIEDPVSLLLLVFGAAIAAAGLAGLVGFSAAVAAFLVGLLLRGELADVARRRLEPLRDMLAAVFFAYFGLTTALAQIPGVVLPAVALAAVTVGTKMLTGWSLTGLSRAARLRAGALLSTRGEFSVVVAGLAAASGALPPQFHALVTTYVIVTASATPFLARAFDRRRDGTCSTASAAAQPVD